MISMTLALALLMIMRAVIMAIDLMMTGSIVIVVVTVRIIQCIRIEYWLIC